MRNRPPILAIYRKELTETLRDRRTLMAMVVIPVVLYPVLMIGLFRAAESEITKAQAQEFTIEVPDGRTQNTLQELIDQTREQTDEQAGPPANFKVVVGSTPPQQLGDEVQLLVNLDHSTDDDADTSRLQVRIQYTEININSSMAMEQLTRLLSQLNERMSRQKLQKLLAQTDGRAPPELRIESILDPVEITTESTASRRERGGWALGQIIPVLLVMMIITGAIYPAIDLTAGERERGTLETLMTTPAPVMHLILGKFLVVATVGMVSGILNVASIAATMYFGGVSKMVTEQLPMEIPFSVFPIIILCMVPFAMLFAAVLIAVCSFARSFKEAQNYVMPVIICALIPAFAVIIPTVRLQGALLIVPVGNMVLLTKELFQGSYTTTMVLTVLLSTSLYAAAALAVATRLFGQEAVLFSDAGSYKAMLLRRYFKPTRLPGTAQALLVVALLFPASFYAQSMLAGAGIEDIGQLLKRLALLQFLGLFVLLPLAITWYSKASVSETFRLRLPPMRGWLAALLMGVSAWVLAHEFFVLQSRLFPPSEASMEYFAMLEQQLQAMPAWLVVLLMAAVPGLCEEWLFRGYLLSGLSGRFKKWSAIIIAGAIFGVFHFVVDKIPVTALLGILLGYFCWQTRSIWPGVVFHVLHNGLSIVLMRLESFTEWLGMNNDPAAATAHLPAKLLVPAAVLFIIGLALLKSLGDGQKRTSEA